MTKKKTSAKKKLLPAIGMLAISGAMLASSTYAWFTMSREVKVTGMELKTKVSGNLLISDNNIEASYTTQTLNQVRKALLEPVSSVNATDGSFFYTVNAKGNGDAVADVYTAYNEDTTLTAGTAIDLITSTQGTDGQNHPITSGAGKAKVDDNFNGSDAYKIGTYAVGADKAFENAYGYVDYVFYLKGTGDSTDTLIKMTNLNMLYNDAAIGDSIDGETAVVGANVDRAWRAAVFVSNVTDTAPGTGEVAASNATSGNLKGIFTLQGAANHNDAGGKNYAVSGASAAPTAMTLGYNTWSDSDGVLATVNNGQTAYLKVTIRVWLEGEDTTCTSKTYAQLTDKWTLDCGFTLTHANVASEAAITKINSETT